MKTLILLFRIFFPSWAFFDEIGHTASLNYRTSEDTPWIPMPASPKTKLGNLFLNPKGNLYLAKNNLLLQLMMESQDPPKQDQWVTYQLVKNMVETSVPNSNKYQFQILVSRDGTTEELLTSPMYEKRLYEKTI